MGERDIAWPVARPAEEVGVLARATSERAAPKGCPPLFLEGGIKSVGVRAPERPFGVAPALVAGSANGSSARSDRI